MKENLMILTVLILVILASGCTSVSNVIMPSQTVKEIGYRDVLTINDVKTLPVPPVIPDEEISFSFVLENRDEQKSARNVNVNLFDPSIFTVLEKSTNQQTILPLAQELINYKLRAPSTDKIANVITTPTLNFKVNYDFNASTAYDVLVVSEDEIKRLQQVGQTVTVPTTKSFASGPIEIDIELQGNSKTIISGYDAVFLVTIYDRGSGSLLNSSIPKGSLEIRFPYGLVDPEKDVDKMIIIEGDNVVTAKAVTGYATSDCQFSVNGINDDCISDSDCTADWTCVESDPTYIYSASTGTKCINGKCCYDWSQYIKCKKGQCQNPEFSTDKKSIVYEYTQEQTHKEECWCTGYTVDECINAIGSKPQGPIEPAKGKEPDVGFTRVSPRWYCKKDDENKELVCRNDGDKIDLFKKKSPLLYFRIIGVPKSPDLIYKTYTIIATASYTYELRGQYKVEVRPYEMR